jgi:hypothetical protein
MGVPFSTRVLSNAHAIIDFVDKQVSTRGTICKQDVKPLRHGKLNFDDMVQSASKRTV